MGDQFSITDDEAWPLVRTKRYIYKLKNSKCLNWFHRLINPQCVIYKKMRIVSYAAPSLKPTFNLTGNLGLGKPVKNRHIFELLQRIRIDSPNLTQKPVNADVSTQRWPRSPQPRTEPSLCRLARPRPSYLELELSRHAARRTVSCLSYVFLLIQYTYTRDRVACDHGDYSTTALHVSIKQSVNNFNMDMAET